MRMTPAQFSVLSSGRQAGKTKYKNEPVVIDGMWFGSLAEGAYYNYLKILKQAGEITHFLRQVPFDLPGGIKYRLDFMVFYSSGKIDHIDVKGAVTSMFKTKKRQVESLYPIKIRCLMKSGARFKEITI